MERNCAACAMEWSIELEKALRAKIPNKRIEAILRLGPRLKQWSGESEATMAVYNMFDLIPGEDRLFANTIFLRLADAFQFGDKLTRISIVKVFLSLVKHCRYRKSKRIRGIFSKSRVHNYSELLRRVKVVFDTGDVESRALALFMFGCWADFAKDSAQIRHLVLSGLVSSDVLEVRSSLFATGCFSELADDFASVVLEILVNMLASSETLAVVKVAAAQIFSKMGCSYSIAYKAYKAGLKLVLNSSEEDFLVAMLVSLSKLACKSTLLSSEQVEFLVLLLNGEVTLRLRTTALKCLHFIFIMGMRPSLVSESVVKTLFSFVDGAEVPPTMQCQALRILHKVLFCAPALSWADIPGLANLFTIVNNASQSPIMSKSLLAIHVLVNLVIKLRRTEKGSAGFCILPPPSEVVSLIIDRIPLLVKAQLDLGEFNSKVSQEVKSLLHLILLLVREHQDLGILVLDKVKLFIEYLVNTHNTTDNVVNGTLESKEERTKVVISKLALIINRFVLSCLERLYEAGSITNEVFDKVKLLVDSVCECSLFDCYTCLIYSLMLQSQTVWGHMVDGNEETGEVGMNSHKSLKHFLVERKTIALEMARRLLSQKDSWPAYRAGMYATCQGNWFIAAFIVGQLTLKVRSDTYRTWFKSLTQVAHSEQGIQQALIQKQWSSSENCLEMKESAITFTEETLCKVGQDAVRNINEPDYSQAFVVACQGIESARRMLEKIATTENTFCFQKWFLALRKKLLRAVADLVRILSTMTTKEFIISNDDEQVGLEFTQQMTEISSQLKRLSQEFDLIAKSSIGMDGRSLKIIKSLALSSSLLAFTAGFALNLPSLPAHKTSTIHCSKRSQKLSFIILIQNLAGRLWNLDCEISAILCTLSEVTEQSKSCFLLQPRNRILNIGCEAKDILGICNYAVSGIVCLHNEAREAHAEAVLSEITKKGLQLCSNIIHKLMCVPFCLPKYFFSVRPSIGSELFVSNADTINIKGIFVMTGCHLSLNVCLQLKNVPQDFTLQLAKLYCILCVSQNFTSNGQSKMTQNSEPWERVDMVEMNEHLFRYVAERKAKISHGKRHRDNDVDNDYEILYAFAEFEPNERGQGFSNCLLDVSRFPVGSYQIRWHSCCVDRQGTYCSLLPLNSEPVFTILR